MNYWFLYNLSDGSIYGSPYLGNADSWTNIPVGCAVIGPFPQDTASVTVQDAYTHPNYYAVQNGSLVPVANIADLKLADAKRAKIAEITSAYQSELYGTFTSSTTGTTLVYDYSKSSEELWKDLKDSVNGGDIPDTSFPMKITLADGTRADHSKVQLQQIFTELVQRKISLYQKQQAKVATDGTIMSATTIDAVNVITW